MFDARCLRREDDEFASFHRHRLGGLQNGYDLWHRPFFSTSPVGNGDGRVNLLLRGLTFELTGAEQIDGIWARLF